MFCNMLREVRLKSLDINMNINCRSYWLYNMYINRWFALAENFPMKTVRSRITVNFDFTLFMYLQKKLMYSKKQDIFYTKDVILRYNRWKTLYFFLLQAIGVNVDSISCKVSNILLKKETHTKLAWTKTAPVVCRFRLASYPGYLLTKWEVVLPSPISFYMLIALTLRTGWHTFQMTAC